MDLDMADLGGAAQLQIAPWAIAAEIAHLRGENLRHLFLGFLGALHQAGMLAKHGNRNARQVVEAVVREFHHLHPHGPVQPPDGIQKAIPQLAAVPGTG
jgi:hypothetical protein